VRLESHPDARAFLSAAGPLLAADEARHNLMYAICSTLIDTPSAYPEAYFWTVEDTEPIGAFLMTPPFNIVVAHPRSEDAIPFAAGALHAGGVHLPGAGGVRPEIDRFADAWQKEAGILPRVRMAQGVYAARSVRPPSDVPGGAREAGVADRELVFAWFSAFQEEAMHEDTPRADLERLLERRLTSETAGIVLWEVDSKPVSLCGYGGRTPHGIRIGPVYTPRARRGNGYASALTAHVTKQQLESGRDYCFLYTDLANPTSNHIYVNIGYEPACEAVDYAFD
jgi:uncharacterized protein